MTRAAWRVAIYPADLQGISWLVDPTRGAALGHLVAALPAPLAARTPTALLLGAE
jgi:hypothetical protein